MCLVIPEEIDSPRNWTRSKQMKCLLHSIWFMHYKTLVYSAIEIYIQKFMMHMQCNQNSLWNKHNSIENLCNLLPLDVGVIVHNWLSHPTSQLFLWPACIMKKNSKFFCSSFLNMIWRYCWNYSGQLLSKRVQSSRIFPLQRLSKNNRKSWPSYDLRNAVLNYYYLTATRNKILQVLHTLTYLLPSNLQFATTTTTTTTTTSMMILAASSVDWVLLQL